MMRYLIRKSIEYKSKYTFLNLMIDSKSNCQFIVQVLMYLSSLQLIIHREYVHNAFFKDFQNLKFVF